MNSDWYDPEDIVLDEFKKKNVYYDAEQSNFKNCILYTDRINFSCWDGQPIIYFLVNRAKRCVDYVGKADNLKNRVNSGHHIYDYSIHDVVVLRVFDYDKIYKLEADMIRIFRPPKNNDYSISQYLRRKDRFVDGLDQEYEQIFNNKQETKQ